MCEDDAELIMNLFIGVDVSKSRLDTYFKNKNFSFTNDNKGITRLLTKLQKEIESDNKIKLIVCEASDGYEKVFAKYMRKENLPIHVAHANKRRAFAKSK